MTSAPVQGAEWAFCAYEDTRHRLPVTDFPTYSQQVNNLSDLAPDFDLFLLDAFGVLNIGEQAIPGAVDRITALQAMGKTVMVVSNAASYPKRVLLDRYLKLGFAFTLDDVLSSREVTLGTLATMAPAHLGIMCPDTYGREELEAFNFDYLGDDPAIFARVEQFVLLGSGTWSEARQTLLETALRINPRPVLVGNPDIVAPRDTGLSKEPGHYAHRLADATGITPQFFGKPFGPVFDMALDVVRARVGRDIDPNRTVMVGDTLQTDILGGRAAGVKTALITGYGALRGMDAGDAISRSGIVPDYIMPRP